jgi:glycosyltransferase involved in cell wall biosynthesis
MIGLVYQPGGLRIRKATAVVLAATPAALFGPWALGVPVDAGLLVIVLLLLLWRPDAMRRAAGSSAFHVLGGLAVLALLLSGRVDPATSAYGGKFLAGALTGIALHFVYLEEAREGAAPRHRTALLLAGYVALLSFLAVLTGAGHTQFAWLSMTLATLLLFYLLRSRGRALLLGTFVPAVLLLNSKVLLFALLAGCLVMGNLRSGSGGLRFLWFRTAVIAVLLIPLALIVLRYSNPERFEDLVRPTRSHSTMARLDLAAAGVAAFRDNPFLGLGGYGMNIDYNFHRYYEEHNLAPLIAEGRTRSHGEVYGSGFTSGVHNMFLDYLTTYGGISFAILMVLLARGLMLGLRQGYAVKVAAALTILVLGFGWQYTASGFGTALLVFACWPFRFTAGPSAAVSRARQVQGSAIRTGGPLTATPREAARQHLAPGRRAERVYFYPHGYLRDRHLDTIRSWSPELVVNPELERSRTANQVSRETSLAKTVASGRRFLPPVINVRLRPRSLPPDVVVYSWGALMLSGPYIIELDNPYALTRYNLRAVGPYRAAIRRLLLQDRCREIRCISRACRETLGALFGSAVYDKATVHYPRLPDPAVGSVEVTSTCRFLFISTQFEIKAGPTVLRAFREVHRSHAACTLDVITHLPDSCAPMVAACPAIRVHAARYTRAEIWDQFMRQADVLVHPTIVESFGMVVLEALAHGLALVATDVYAVGEMVEDGENGVLLAPPMSIWDGYLPSREYRELSSIKEKIRSMDDRRLQSDLVAAMTRLVTDVDFRRESRGASLRLFRERFSGEAS